MLTFSFSFILNASKLETTKWNICVVYVRYSICALSRRTFFEDLVPEVAQTRCSASRHLSWSALLRSFMSCSWCTDGGTATISRLRSKTNCPVNISGLGANEEGHPQVDHAEEGLNDPPSCDATGYTGTHNEIMRTYSTHSSVPVQNVRRRRAEQPKSFVNLRTASKRMPLVRNQLRRNIIVSCVFWQGLSQGFLREADCGVRVHLSSPVRPPPPKTFGPSCHTCSATSCDSSRALH